MQRDDKSRNGINVPNGLSYQPGQRCRCPTSISKGLRNVPVGHLFRVYSLLFSASIIHVNDHRLAFSASIKVTAGAVAKK